jgi:hypothetical protein
LPPFESINQNGYNQLTLDVTTQYPSYITPYDSVEGQQQLDIFNQGNAKFANETFI